MHGTTIWGVDDPTSSFEEASGFSQKYADMTQIHKLSSLFEPIWARYEVKKEKRKRTMMDCTIEVVDNYLRSTEKNVEGEKYHDMLRATADGMTRRYKERQQAKSSMSPTSLPSDALNKETAMTHHGSTPQTPSLSRDPLPSTDIQKWSNVTLSLPKRGLHVFNIPSELKVDQPQFAVGKDCRWFKYDPPDFIPFWTPLCMEWFGSIGPKYHCDPYTGFVLPANSGE